MKTIYLVRHGKSSWDNPGLNDFERPLNPRGRRDAPFMGSILNKLNIKPDAIISSPANRAAMTARIFAHQTSYPLENIYYTEILYGADESDLSELVKTIQEKTSSIAIVGHNPGLTDFAHYICDTDISNIPTSAVFCAKLEVDLWKDFKKKCGEFHFFEFPKKYKKLIT